MKFVLINIIHDFYTCLNLIINRTVYFVSVGKQQRKIILIPNTTEKITGLVNILFTIRKKNENFFSSHYRCRETRKRKEKKITTTFSH